MKTLDIVLTKLGSLGLAKDVGDNEESCAIEPIGPLKDGDYIAWHHRSEITVVDNLANLLARVASHQQVDSIDDEWYPVDRE